jgi:hypothetical protein
VAEQARSNPVNLTCAVRALLAELAAQRAAPGGGSAAAWAAERGLARCQNCAHSQLALGVIVVSEREPRCHFDRGR